MRVALATCAELPGLAEDDRSLVGALARRGVEAAPVVWDDDGVDLGAFDACVIRSTWDYTLRRDAFVGWAARAAARTRLWNRAGVVAWNSHKGYLRELATRGVPVVPTAFAPAGARLDVAALGWDEVVVKPCVSAGARDTTRGDVRAAQAALDALADRDRMVQPYQPAVEGEGERSLVFFAGAFSHAIRKHPALAPDVARPASAGSGATAGEPAVTPAEDELAAARAVLDTTRALLSLDAPLLYARVDLVRDAAGQPRLMELEALEPRLFLTTCPAAADRLADAILRS